MKLVRSKDWPNSENNDGREFNWCYTQISEFVCDNNSNIEKEYSIYSENESVLIKPSCSYLQVGKVSDWTLVFLFVIGTPINLFSLFLLLQKMLSFQVFPKRCYYGISNLCRLVRRKTCWPKPTNSGNRGRHTFDT